MSKKHFWWLVESCWQSYSPLRRLPVIEAKDWDGIESVLDDWMPQGNVQNWRKRTDSFHERESSSMGDVSNPVASIERHTTRQRGMMACDGIDMEIRYLLSVWEGHDGIIILESVALPCFQWLQSAVFQQVSPSNHTWLSAENKTCKISKCFLSHRSYQPSVYGT